jgi:REP element-mobilizing transposase RayT
MKRPVDPTRPRRTHKYNPSGPAGYLLTFHTYGTWLRGDERGTVDRKAHNNVPGTPMLGASPELSRLDERRLMHPPVTLTPSQRALVETTVRQVSAYRRWTLHAVHVRTQHIHLVVTAQGAPERMMASLKSWCTRKLRREALWESPHSLWARHGSTRYLWDEEAIRAACAYVLHGQGAPLAHARGSA